MMYSLLHECPNCGEAIVCDDSRPTKHCNKCGANYRITPNGSWIRTDPLMPERGWPKRGMVEDG